MSKHYRGGRLPWFCLAALLSPAGPAFGDTLHVPSEYSTIQAAIDAAQPSDIVEIADGMYTGAGNRNLDFAGKAITVRSASGNPTSCVLDCERDGRGFNFHSGEGSSAVVEGLTITNGVQGGITCHGSSPTITNCIIKQNRTGQFGGGVNCDAYSSPTFVNCAILENHSGHRGGGVHCNNYSSPTFVNCTIAGNTAGSAGGAIYIRYYSDPTLTNCILWGNTPQQISIDTDFSGNPVVTYCDIQGGWSGTGNIDADPLFAFPDDCHLMSGSSCIDMGTNTPPGGLPSTDPDGNPRSLDGDGNAVATADMGVYEFNPAAPSIAVSPTTYKFFGLEGGDNPSDQTLSLRNCGGGALDWEITGEPAWLTVLPTSGESNGEVNQLTLSTDISGLPYGAYMAALEIVGPQAVNSPHQVNVILHIGGATLNVPSEYATIQAAIDAALAGDEVVIGDGTYTGAGNKNLTFYGKPITVRSDSGDPALCIIDCQGSGIGFAFNRGEGPNSLVHGLTIANANGSAVSCQSDSSPTLVNCSIIGSGSGNGVGVGTSEGNDSSHPTLINCTISGGYADVAGGGVSCWRGAVTLIGCTISGNYGEWGGGGIYVGYGDATLINCSITGNSTGGIGYGGGIANDSNNRLLIVNCTIADNAASFRGGVDGPVSAANCVLWGNSPDQIVNAYAYVNYCDIEGGWPGGTGNIDADPMFVDPDGPDDDPNTWDDNDYRLSGGSPCIDAGDTAAVPVDEWDLDGDGDTTERVPIDLWGLPRFVDDPETPDTGAGTPPLVDMGSHEYQPDCNTNGISDVCDIDCGASGGPCDMPGCGESADCNGNGDPDECDPDCDGDVIPDDCEIADCLPDDPSCQDCNGNGVPDGCDLNDQTSEDCDANGVPDECGPVCDDGDACTDDSCDPETGCAHAPTNCDDGIACTTDTCDPDTGCANTPVDSACGDGNVCTVDTCDTGTGCVNDGTGVTGPCDDENACTTSDVCQGDSAGTCQGTDTSGVDCDDGVACTTDTCDEVTGCANTPVDEACDDSDACTDDACDPGSGCLYTPTNCDDGDNCTLDSCDSAAGCEQLYQQRLFGDIVGSFCPPNCPQPDLDDVLCILDGFAAGGDWQDVCPDGDLVTTSPPECGGDGQISLEDIMAVLDAFAHNSPCPDPCP